MGDTVTASGPLSVIVVAHLSVLFQRVTEVSDCKLPQPLQITTTVPPAIKRLAVTMSSIWRVSVGGNTFVCDKNASSAMLLANTPLAGVPDGVVCDVNGVPVPRFVLIVMANCVFDAEGRAERISPALLGVLLRCYGAAHSPEAKFYEVLKAAVHDRTLAGLCKTAMNYTPKMSATKAIGCQSLHHPRDGRPCKLDPRSRSPRCAQCYTVEDNVRKASWPLVLSLPRRLDTKSWDTINRAISTLTRPALASCLAVTHHDVQMAKIPKIDRVGHWLHKVTAHANTIESLRRSKYVEELQKCLDAIATTGWAAAPPAWQPRSLGQSLVVVAKVIALTEFVEAVRLLCRSNVTIHLTAPGSTHNSAGPLDKFTLHDLVNALGKGTTLFHGCRVPPSSPALELVSAFGKLGWHVERAPLGPEHAYVGANRAVREFLASEEETEWVGPAVAPELGKLVQCIRTGGNGQKRVCNVLRNPAGRPAKRRQKAAADGEESPKRPAVSAAETHKDEC